MATTSNPLPDTGFVRLKQIIGDPKRGIPPLIPVSRAHWYEGIKQGRFPAPDKRFGERISVWNVADILPESTNLVSMDTFEDETQNTDFWEVEI